MSRRTFFLFLLAGIALAWIIPEDWLSPEDRRVFAPRSEFSDIVTIEDVSWGNGRPYLSISVNNPGEALQISGWGIEDESGRRSEIGRGVQEFRLGELNTESPIIAATGTSLIISLSPSPVGASFKENSCSAYLRGTEPFSPPIEERCPSAETIPGFSELDPTCKTLAQSLPRCQTISPEHLAQVTPTCGAFFRTALTYGHCLIETRGKTGEERWRIFLPAGEGLIRAGGGFIYLTDGKGMLVDSYRYETIGVQEPDESRTP